MENNFSIRELFQWLNLQPIEDCILCAKLSYPTLYVDNEHAANCTQTLKNGNITGELKIRFQ